jgi:spore coat protein U-like protein
MKIKSAGAIALAMFGLAASTAQAATVTNTMPVRIVIQNACNVTATAPTTLDFGTQGPLVANVDQTSTITVLCTTSAPYNVGLDGGLTGTVAARKMMNGVVPVFYELFRDSSRTLNWGNTVGTDTLAGTGNGTSQALPVYGRVPPQTTPAAGTYLDTVAVTVTY